MKKITVNIPDEIYDLLYEYCLGYYKLLQKNTADCSSNKNLNK